jgi:hypothetical protein
LRSHGATIVVAGIFVVFVAAGDSVEGTIPTGLCVVSKAGGEVIFTRLSHRAWSWDLGAPARTTIPELEVRRVGFRFVWGIQANNADSLVETVAYGRLPTGYSQSFPDSGDPAPLEVGEAYEMTCGLGEGAFAVTASGIENLDPGRVRVTPCTCAPGASLSAALTDASDVFVGTVLKVTRPADPTDNGYRNTEFSVSRWLKGSGGDRTIVLDGPRGCMVYFEEGRRFLVYARHSPQGTDLVTDMCTRTKPLDRDGQREADLITQQLQGDEVAPRH